MFKTKQQPVSANLLLSSVRYLITNPTRQVQQLFTTKKATSKRIPIRSQKALFSPFIYILRRLTLKPKTAATFIQLPLLSSISKIAPKTSTSRNNSTYSPKNQSFILGFPHNHHSVRLLTNQVHKFETNKII